MNTSLFAYSFFFFTGGGISVLFLNLPRSIEFPTIDGFLIIYCSLLFVPSNKKATDLAIYKSGHCKNNIPAVNSLIAS